MTCAQHELLLKIANQGYGLGGLIGIDMGTKEHAEAVSAVRTNPDLTAT
jgi:hypothetical protein